MPLVADVYDSVLQDGCKVQLSLELVYMQHGFIISKYRAHVRKSIPPGATTPNGGCILQPSSGL